MRTTFVVLHSIVCLILATACKERGADTAEVKVDDTFDVTLEEADGIIKPAVQRAQGPIGTMATSIATMTSFGTRIDAMGEASDYRALARDYSEALNDALDAMSQATPELRAALQDLRLRFDQDRTFSGSTVERTTLNAADFKRDVLDVLGGILGNPANGAGGQLQEIVALTASTEARIKSLQLNGNMTFVRATLQSVQTNEVARLVQASVDVQSKVTGLMNRINSWVFHRGEVVKTTDAPPINGITLGCAGSNHVNYDANAMGRFFQACESKYHVPLVGVLNRTYDANQMTVTVAANYGEAVKTYYGPPMNGGTSDLSFNSALSTAGGLKQPSLTRRMTLTVKSNRNFEFVKESVNVASTQGPQPEYSNCHWARDKYFEETCLAEINNRMPFGTSLTGQQKVLVGGYCSVPTCDKNTMAGQATASGQLTLIYAQFDQAF